MEASARLGGVESTAVSFTAAQGLRILGSCGSPHGICNQVGA